MEIASRSLVRGLHEQRGMWAMDAPRSAVREAEHQGRAQAHALLIRLPEVMLATFARAGDPAGARVRPMHVDQLDPDSALWFMTSLSSEVVAQARACAEAMVVGRSSGRCARLAGQLEIVTARERVRSLWTQAHEALFPLGPADPDLGLLHFIPRDAEFWDLGATS